MILFLTDDMRLDDLASLGGVRSLFREDGVTFTNAFSSNSLCCPARATLLTGQYAHNHHTMGNLPRQGGGWEVFHANNDSATLLPTWLRPATWPRDKRYRTYYTGKYLNGWNLRRSEPGWDRWDVPIAGAYNYTRWTAWHRAAGKERAIRYPRPGQRYAYQQRVQTAGVVNRVTAWAPSSRPFFIFAGSLAPHAASRGGWSPATPEREYADSVTSDMPRSPAFSERDLSDKPTWVQTRAENADTRYARMNNVHRHRVRSLRSVVDTVQETVTALRRAHDLRNTVIIFTSDNGFVLGEHQLTGKNMAYHDSIAIPLLIRGPGFAHGATVEQPVSLADVTATIAAAARVTPTLVPDGVPLQPMDTHPGLYADRPILLEGSGSEYPGAPRMRTDADNRFYLGVATAQRTYVQYYRGRNEMNREDEFYDETQDPWQLDNAWDPEGKRASVSHLMRAWALAHSECVGPSCNDPLPLK